MTLSSNSPIECLFSGCRLGEEKHFVLIQELETQMGHIHSELGGLKLVIKELLEENHRLSLENEQLGKF